MHRRPLLDLIDVYRDRYPEESACVARIRALLEEHPDCFERTCRPGHVTASSWIVSHDLERVLFTHHRKLGRWLQLGGHADGESCALDVAVREAQEESGMQRFRVVGSSDPAIPFDIDVHGIAARKGESAHEHHDIRYLLVAEPDQPLVKSDESIDLRWFTDPEISAAITHESLLRMRVKALSALASLAGQPAGEPAGG